jgi:putative membrane protein
MTAWDLFLDPQMTAERYWQWERPGHYRGIPLSNYAGWLVTSAGLMLALERLLPPTRADRLLVAEYAAMGAMETLGFAVFFRDRTVALVGAIGMLPLAVMSMVRRG